jgi:G3E family GTPase
VLRDGTAFFPALFLDGRTVVGTAPSTDGRFDRLLHRDGDGSLRELRRLPAGDNPAFDAFTIDGDRLAWTESTAGGRVRLWTVHLRDGSVGVVTAIPAGHVREARAARTAQLDDRPHVGGADHQQLTPGRASRRRRPRCRPVNDLQSGAADVQADVAAFAGQPENGGAAHLGSSGGGYGGASATRRCRSSAWRRSRRRQKTCGTLYNENRFQQDRGMRSRPSTATAPPPVDHQPRVTVLAGFAPAATEAVARALLVTYPRLVLIRHDISRIRDGAIRRTVRTADDVLEDEVVELVHGCMSCTLREDVLPTLVRMGRRRGSDIVLALPPTIEPEAVAAACEHCAVDGAAVTDVVRFDSYVTVVEAAGFLNDLSSTDDLRHRGLHAADNDNRSVADVLARQVEYADTIVVWGHPARDGFDDAQLNALLHRLAPWAAHVRVGDTATVDCTGLAGRLRHTGRHDPQTPGMLARAMEGFSIGVHDPAGDCGAVSVLFRARRPFHPQRLHDALEDLTTEALRGRGQLWIASQPDVVIGWESAGGGINLGSLGHCLAALPADRWDEATALRRMAADLDWDPYYGDRLTALAFIGLRLDADAITETLTACLLTDAELADGFDAWTAMPDPFDGFFALRDDTTEEN